jgi:DNA-binding CsgD family transcriptional regulator
LQREVVGKNVRAHRFAWELEYGPIPDGWQVVQMCGIRRCVRLSHLSLLDPREGSRALTPRHFEILQRLSKTGPGYGSLKVVARDLGLAHGTVHHHVYEIRKRLGVSSTREAIERFTGTPVSAIKRTEPE